MDRQAKRRIVVEDVLAQLRLGKIDATAGTYCRPLGYYNDGGECEACALGSLFLARVRGRLGSNDFSEPARWTDSYIMREKLGGIFTEQELWQIECAFELTEGEWDCYRGDEERLRAILANALRNGRFVIADLRGPRARTPYPGSVAAKRLARKKPIAPLPKMGEARAVQDAAPEQAPAAAKAVLR